MYVAEVFMELAIIIHQPFGILLIDANERRRNTASGDYLTPTISSSFFFPNNLCLGCRNTAQDSRETQKIEAC